MIVIMPSSYHDAVLLLNYFHHLLRMPLKTCDVRAYDRWCDELKYTFIVVYSETIENQAQQW